MIASELPENRNTSLTNLCEYLSWDVGRVYLPGRFEEEHPFDWVEHHPGEPFHSIRSHRDDSYALATFEDFRPRIVWLGGVKWVRIGQPGWAHVTAEELEACVGLPSGRF